VRPDSRPIRQPYQKPHLRTIDLAADEVLAVGCKLPAGSGPLFGGPLCLLPTQCFEQGS
jgi:hypothetical protein